LFEVSSAADLLSNQVLRNFSIHRWNNHQPNFISVFSSLLLNETLVDVTLAAEGRQLQAHKVVLSACSSYFQVSLRFEVDVQLVSIILSFRFSVLVHNESLQASDRHPEGCAVQRP
jgi:hypothetical protein